MLGGRVRPIYFRGLTICWGGGGGGVMPKYFMDLKISPELQTTRQSLLSLHMTKSYVRTATRFILKVEANLTQILNFKANFHTEFEPFFKKKNYANNGGHFKIVSIKIKK